ncbi:MAG: hypothetical protein ABEH43_05610, partial [Flavobacteriales bacterium]
MKNTIKNVMGSLLVITVIGLFSCSDDGGGSKFKAKIDGNKFKAEEDTLFEDNGNITVGGASS